MAAAAAAAGASAAKRQALLAQRLDSGCAATRAALAAGSIDADQAAVITRVIAELPPGTDPELREAAERRLVAEAATYDAATLARIGQHILEVIDPDGVEARLGDALAAVEARHAKRSLAMPPDLDGMVALRGRLDGEGAAIVHAALDPLAAPRPTDAHSPDPRSAGQRYADALVELCRQALTAGHLPEAGGEKPQLTVSCDLDALRTSRRGGLLDTGDAVSPATLRRLACDAALIPTVLDSQGMPLDVGRKMRLVPPAIRRALVLRDRGCAFPGCTRPPAWCDAHHIIFWADGGPTALDNTVLLCGHHHRLVHKGHWTVQLGPDKRPEFLPPEWIDPKRKPLRNTMHHRR